MMDKQTEKAIRVLCAEINRMKLSNYFKDGGRMTAELMLWEERLLKDCGLKPEEEDGN